MDKLKPKPQSMLIAAAILLLVGAGVGIGARDRFPRPTGYVNDFADVISPDAERLIAGIAADVKAKTGAEIAVVTIGSTGGADIEEYSLDLFMEWGIGEEGRDNGVLLLAAFQDQQLWIKTGYGLEGAIPDAEASRIYRNVLRPGFRAGQYDQALVTATSMLAELILAETGQSLTVGDSLAYDRMLLRSTDEMARRSRQLRLFAQLFGIFMPILLVILVRIVAARRGYGRRHGGLFWIGGFGGSSGGFGGGFGGFGGGSAGGGGAGGGW
jgi:uncharacterized protein